MNQNLTEIVCVVDRSGSMAKIQSDAVGAFNTFLKAQRNGPDEARFTLVLFNHEYQLVCDGVPISQAAELTDDTYQPAGTTALLDAVGRTIDTVGKRLADTPEPARPARVLVATLTDGQENSSSDYTLERVRTLIKQQQEVYAWRFEYLAASEAAFQAGASMGIAVASCKRFDATPKGIRTAYQVLTSDINTYRSGR